MAILFDLEDMQQMPLVERMVTEAARYGTPIIRRAYGNWDSPGMPIWKKCLVLHEIETMQRLDNSGVKNASDTAMIIDAMDIPRSNEI